MERITASQSRGAVFNNFSVNIAINEFNNIIFNKFIFSTILKLLEVALLRFKKLF